MSEYFNSIYNGIKTLISGMSLSMQHFQNRKKLVATLQYPHEKWPIPERDIGHANEDYNVIRSRLHVDIDDCISCRMCERACPVDCIKIEDVKPKKGSDFDCGITSNDTKKKLLVTRFSIDMSECMYCNLCVYPCPEECIYMVGGPNEHKHDIDYEFSKRERGNLIYEFANATEDQILDAGGSDYIEKINKKDDLYQQAMRIQEIELEGEIKKDVAIKDVDKDAGHDLPLDINLLKQIKNRVSKGIARKHYRIFESSGKTMPEIADGIEKVLIDKNRMSEDVVSVINLLKGNTKKSDSVESSTQGSKLVEVSFDLDSLKAIESRVVRGIAKKLYKALDADGKNSNEIASSLKEELEAKGKYTDDVKTIIEPVLNQSASSATQPAAQAEVSFDLDSLKAIESRVVRGIAKKLYKALDAEGKSINEISNAIKAELESKGKYTDDVKSIIE